MLVTEAPGIDESSVRRSELPSVAEAGLQRLDDEPRAELVDGLLRQGGALCDEHLIFPFRARPLYEGPECCVAAVWSCGGAGEDYFLE